MKSAAVLARVSTEDQAREGTSLDAQVDACIRRASEEGYEVAPDDIYREEGVSGAAPLEERPTLLGVLQTLKDGRVEAVYVYSPDRLARDPVEFGLIQREARGQGQGIRFVTISADDSPESRLLLDVSAAFAGYERRLIQRRTLQGRRRTLEAGNVGPGRIPYGYRRDGRRLRIDEEEAAVVRRIFNLYVHGDGPDGKHIGADPIADRLSADKVPTAKGGRWWRSGTVLSILGQWAYVGLMWHMRGTGKDTHRIWALSEEEMRAKGWLPVPVPPIIDRALFDAAQRKREEYRRAGDGSSVSTASYYPLAGRIFCGLCGRVYSPRDNGRTKGATSWLRYYICRGSLAVAHRDGKERCPNPSVPADVLEAHVLLRLLDSLGEPEQTYAAAGAHLQQLEARQSGLRSQLEPNQARLKAVRARLARLDLRFDRGTITREQFEEQLADLRDEERRVTARDRAYARTERELRMLDLRVDDIRVILQHKPRLLVTASSVRRTIRDALPELRALADRRKGVRSTGGHPLWELVLPIEVFARDDDGTDASPLEEIGELTPKGLLTRFDVRLTVMPGEIRLDGGLPLGEPLAWNRGATTPANARISASDGSALVPSPLRSRGPWQQRYGPLHVPAQSAAGFATRSAVGVL